MPESLRTSPINRRNCSWMPKIDCFSLKLLRVDTWVRFWQLVYYHCNSLWFHDATTIDYILVLLITFILWSQDMIYWNFINPSCSCDQIGWWQYQNIPLCCSRGVLAAAALLLFKVIHEPDSEEASFGVVQYSGVLGLQTSFTPVYLDGNLEMTQ